MARASMGTDGKLEIQWQRDGWLAVWSQSTRLLWRQLTPRGRYTTVQLRVAVDASSTLKARNSSCSTLTITIYFTTAFCLALEGKYPIATNQRACSQYHKISSTTPPVPLHLLRKAWNAFACQLDIDMEQSFQCPVCLHVQTLLSVTVPWLAIGRISYLHLSITSFLHSLSEVVITKRGCTSVHYRAN